MFRHGSVPGFLPASAEVVDRFPLQSSDPTFLSGWSTVANSSQIGSAGQGAGDRARTPVDARKGVWLGRGREKGVRGGFGEKYPLKRL